MKIAKYLLGLGLMAGMGLSSCTNDEPSVVVPGNDGNETFFATVTLSLPTANGSRSATQEDGTSEHGTIDGTKEENSIKSILVILATLDNNGNYQLETVNQGDASLNGAMTATPKYTIKFDNEIVLELAGKQVYPFVVCNPDASTVNRLSNMSRFTTDFANDIISLQDPNNFSGWLSNNFLMTNASIDKTASAITMPELSELQSYNTVDNPFSLTSADKPIKVERNVARFDFKSTQLSGLDANTYEIRTDAAENPATIGFVKLTDMALINEAQDFYLFRRTSDDGTEDNWTIGGAESWTNYLVSPNSKALDRRNFMLAGFDTNGAIAPASFAYTSLNGMGTDYSVWRYATENAIPGESNQVKKYTTGVVFKGNITFSDTEIAAEAALGKPIYKFGNTIYGSIDQLKAEIQANPNTYLAYQAKEANLYSGIDADGNLEGFVSDESTYNTTGGPQLSAKGFTVYRADSNGDYNVYYYYWNRHNDNGDPNKMGPMEFGVVRNNVYRLAVTNIHNFGHPGNPSDDPDPEKPNDPDETVDLYISLDVQVLPWTMRYNNIEF